MARRSGWSNAAYVTVQAVITTAANELVAYIHDRMPVVLARGDYARWLGEQPDPRDLIRSFPAELMRMWPISSQPARKGQSWMPVTTIPRLIEKVA